MAGNRPGDWHVLDLDKDPTPGDPDRVRHLAQNLLDFADDVGEALRSVKGMADEDAVLKWAGKSAKAFGDEFSGVPKQLKKLKKSYEMAGDALAAYWPELERAQALADKALAKGREAQSDLSSAKSRLSSVDSWVTRANKEADKYKDDPAGSRDKEKPDEAKVRAATRDAQHAQSAQTSARSDVTSASGALDAAKKMAEDARKMREEAARTAKTKIDEASDAGIHNRKWWEEVGDWFSDNWDTIVAVCKVVVAVVGIIAMIIGGPILGAIVLIAALVVLADTLNKYAKGQASLWDVAFAALDCIPGGKGLTSLGKLAKGMRGLGKMGLKGMAMGIKGMGKNARLMGRQMKKLFTCGDPIDMATGQMVTSATDVQLDGVLPLLIERHHRTGTRSGRLFGRSWTSTLDQRLLLDATGVRFATADGMVLHYPIPEPGLELLPVEGPHWPLSWDGATGGELTVHQPHAGVTLRFRPLPGRPAGELPLAAVSDRNDNTMTIAYDATGLPTEVAHHGGYRIGVTTEHRRVTALTLLSAPDRPTLLRYGYDQDGNLAEIHDSSGRPQRLFYDDRRRVTGWEDRTGAWYRYTYDGEDRCVAAHGIDGVLDYTFAYDDEAHVTTAVNSLGHTTTYGFNDFYQLVAETDPLGHTVLQEWDQRDQLLSRTDELGRTIRLDWGPTGHLVGVRLPDGSASTVRHDDLGRPVETVTYDGAVTRQEWDERGNCSALTSADGAVTRFTRDRSGAVASVTDAVGAVTRFVNNAAGQPTSVTNPLGVVTHATYDAFGRRSSVTDPLGDTTRFAWTVEGRPAARTGPDGATESWTYDGEGNLLTHTDPMGRVTRNTYGPLGVLASRTTPDGARHTFTHDTELRLLQVTGPHGLTWDYTSDAAGRLVTESDFDGRTVSYVYDAAGQLLSRTNPLGQSTAFAYDEVGNQCEKTVDGRSTVYTHDSVGRVLRAAGPDVTLTYAYDAAGRVIGEAADGRALTTEYDVLGRPTRRTTPTGATTTYAYDAAGRRTALVASGHALHSAHDELGRETARGLGGGEVVLTRGWDAYHRPTSMRVTASGSAQPLADRTYTYQADGTPSSLFDRTTGLRAFEQDAAARVTAVRAADWSETYAYDAAGNQTRAEWPDGRPAPEARGVREHSGNRVTRAGSVHYEYDAAGRVVVRRRTRLSRKPDIWRYTWNGEDRLTSVTTPDGTVWRYVYDSLGRRVAKQRLAPGADTHPQAAPVVEEIRFTWDGPHLVEQTAPVPGRPEEVVLTWDRDGFAPVTQTERTLLADASQEVVDERFYAIVTDLVGTPTELVDETGGVGWRSSATLWGLTTGEPDAVTSTPLRFPGQYFDPESGLHYNNLRHYDPTTAAYISPDPLGLDAGPNPRAYVPNPLRWIDYLGLICHSRVLGKNLAADGRPVLAGQAAAHIVPSTLNRVVGRTADSRAILARYGVDIDEAANGIPLGHPRPHNFTHRNPFLLRLNEHLRDTEAAGLAAGLNNAQIGNSIRAELRTIGREVEHELSPGQMVNNLPAPTARWTRLTF
ncbi:RHS repeat-associated core domain-containing protein [Streptomyces sp. Tue6028]|uniref:RHS repeat-associated core domain-containing protein n=1 Tax=Streptomyces sp. Tue6028 TaxID=2036037 RepID=UPI003D72BD28